MRFVSRRSGRYSDAGHSSRAFVTLTCMSHPKVFRLDNSIHSVVKCANYYGLFSLDEIEAESQVCSEYAWRIGQRVIP